MLLNMAEYPGSSGRSRRVPRLPAANPPHHGEAPSVGAPIRVLAIGESSVSGSAFLAARETVTAVTTRVLARLTGRPAVWRAYGLSGATVRDALKRLLPRIAPEPADLLIVAFGVNDATSYGLLRPSLMISQRS
jgi:lysophospholipase L1-like esterase